LFDTMTTELKEIVVALIYVCYWSEGKTIWVQCWMWELIIVPLPKCIFEYRFTNHYFRLLYIDKWIRIKWAFLPQSNPIQSQNNAVWI
jgi:hypothetical protein